MSNMATSTRCALGGQRTAGWSSARPRGTARSVTVSAAIRTDSSQLQQLQQHTQQQQMWEQPGLDTVAMPPAAAPLPRGMACAGRRAFLTACGMTAAGLAIQPHAALAFLEAPDGYRGQLDRLDGYSFVYPDRWAAVTSSGNDVFLRNPFNVDQNLFVDISSPSSSRFAGVSDLGSPEAAADRILDQYLNKEFMSTRLGVRREGEVLAAAVRQGDDGRTYYDIDVRMTSYASRSPYVATQGELMADYGVEWDRRLLTTLGVANKRLYELRLQTDAASYDSDRAVLDTIRRSFRVVEVEQT